MVTRLGFELNEMLKTSKVHYNLSVSQLIEAAVQRGEGMLTETGAFSAVTGKYTGRSPHDKFIVDDPSIHDKIAWNSVNQPIGTDQFDVLYQEILAYLQKKEIFVFDGFAGADPTYRLPIRIVNEFAWQNLFVHQLFIRPSEEELNQHVPGFTVICAPGFTADPAKHGTNSEAFIIVNFAKQTVIIGGSKYAGEMKKSIFGVINYLLPKQGVLSMHCSSNVGEKGDVALFFGLSGTGKTTLSTDPNRRLIGDDEHAWSEKGVFNIEGGCYAKCINLSEEKEPQIWNAIKFGSVLENVVVDEVTRFPDYDNGSLTENSRVAYPVEYIPGAVVPGVAGHANVIIFLTADAFGVLPPISKLSKEQALYYFLSGYTSKLAGTERGVTEPEATFSTCFGAPFLPLEPSMYAKMLGEKLSKHDAQVYLVNTGWTGGAYGVGKRINLSHTRAMVTAAVNGSLKDAKYEIDPIFGLSIPIQVEGVPNDILMPRNTWANKTEYDKTAKDLAQRFVSNIAKFKDVSKEIADAGPKV